MEAPGPGAGLDLNPPLRISLFGEAVGIQCEPLVISSDNASGRPGM